MGSGFFVSLKASQDLSQPFPLPPPFQRGIEGDFALWALLTLGH